MEYFKPSSNAPVLTRPQRQLISCKHLLLLLEMMPFPLDAHTADVLPGGMMQGQLQCRKSQRSTGEQSREAGVLCELWPLVLSRNKESCTLALCPGQQTSPVLS